MFASMLLSILFAGAPDALGPLPCDDAHAWADFEQTHEELALGGSAPLYGMEEEAESPAARALNARSAVPADAAPLFGVEESAPATAASWFVGVAASR